MGECLSVIFYNLWEPSRRKEDDLPDNQLSFNINSRFNSNILNYINLYIKINEFYFICNIKIKLLGRTFRITYK